jgi:RNAse (barnase) inhibitor barstar
MQAPIADSNAIVASLHIEHWPTLSAAATRLGMAVVPADLGGKATSHRVLQHLGEAFAFPEWYGANFDALADCLSDPEWHSESAGLLLMIRGLETLKRAAPDDWNTLLDVLRSAAEARADDGKPFWIIVDTPAPSLPAFAP